MSDSNIRFIKLASYVAPDIKETPSEDWVLNGKNNSFFYYIIDRFNGSPTNGAIINGNKDLMYGRGLADKLTGEELDENVLKILPKEETKKIIFDYSLFYSSVMLVSKKGKKVVGVKQLPRETIGVQKVNDEGEIEGYWYCYDWSNRWKYKPKFYPKFNKDTVNEEEVFVAQTYTPGKFYFSNPEYISGLQYAEAEEEMSNYSINHIKSGLSFGYIINFNNGANLTKEQKDEIEQRITEKLTGSSNAGRFVISFNNGKEVEVTVTAFEVNEAHSQWDWLSKEAESKILRSHRVTNPILVGIKENVGLGNNADEMDVSERQYMKRVISPKQEVLIDAFEEILEAAGIKKELYFLPLSEVDEDGDDIDDEGIKKETNKEEVKETKKVTKEETKLAKLALSNQLIQLGEDMSDWELISETRVNYDTCDIEDAALEMAVLPSTPGEKSDSQDKGLFKVRYKYAPATLTKNDKGEVVSRDFCRQMIEANKVYRKEDIINANSLEVNPGWGEYGTEPYSIWLHKGGGDCHHYWMRQVYFRKRNPDGTFKPNKGLENDKKVSVNEAKKAGFEPAKNEKEVAMLPTDMPKRGFLHRYSSQFKSWLKQF